MAPIADFMKARMFINHLGIGGGGFVETHIINSTVYATSKDYLKEIITNRAAILPYNWQIVHASVSLNSKKNDSSLPVGWDGNPVLLAAEADLSTEALCNDLEACLLYRLDAGNGKTTTRMLRALRDSFVEGNASNYGSTDLTVVGAHTATAAADAYDTAVDNYWNTVAYRTVFLETLGVGSWEPHSAVNVQYLRVSSRDMGQGYSDRTNRRKRAI